MCAFDDVIFQLDWKQRHRLMQQLAEPELKNMLAELHLPSWRHCAPEGGLCNCPTQVRFGHPGIEDQFYSSPRLCDDVTGCSFKCEARQFEKLERRNSAVTHHCECSEPFKLAMKANSKTYVEEALIFLLRFAARAQLVPSTGDRIKSGSKLWTQREPNNNADLYGAGWFDRDWNHMFLHDSISLLTGISGNCLEWGFRRIPKLPHCTSLYEFKLSLNKTEFGVKKIDDVHDKPSHRLISNIFSIYDTLNDSSVMLDLIVAEQVFEHVQDPFKAAKSCFDALNAGGALLLTVPHATQLHVGSNFLDYFRFSKHALKFILTQAGFCVPDAGFASGGDYIIEVARNLGLGRGDFLPEEIVSTYRRGFDQLSEGATNIMAVAFKGVERC
jgi:hypothetical protein